MFSIWNLKGFTVSQGWNSKVRITSKGQSTRDYKNGSTILCWNRDVACPFSKKRAALKLFWGSLITLFK